MANIEELARTGIQAINNQEFDLAIAKFTEALAIDNSRPDLNNALGMSYLHRGQAEEAIPHLQRAVSLTEDHTDSAVQEMKKHFQLGLSTAFELNDELQKAKDILAQARQLWPDHIESTLQLAQLMLSSGEAEEGAKLYDSLLDINELEPEQKEIARALAGSIRAFVESGHPASTFLQAHAESYRSYFNEVTTVNETQGWYLEAARMARGPDGEPRPVIPEGARPYAMQRVDMVNPMDGSVASVYSEQEPMIVALNGLEPLAQTPVTFFWHSDPFDIWVSTRVPWHWLAVTILFEGANTDAMTATDETIGSWYLAGYNGDYGSRDAGRFHFITDLELLGEHRIGFTIDMGRASFDAIHGLLRRLQVLHNTLPIKAILFGQGHLTE